MSNLYATSADLIARNPALANQDLAELEAALSAASRGIDGYCSRRFWIDEDDAPTSRVFAAGDWYELDLGQYEIGDSADVVVKTDDGSGTFATTLSATVYQLEPVNAPYEATGAAPYTMIRRLSGAWPKAYSRQGRQELVQVTARFGWPAVPAAIREACLQLTIVAMENPTGVRSEAIDGYSVSYNRDITAEIESNPQIKARLAPFRRGWAV